MKRTSDVRPLPAFRDPPEPCHRPPAGVEEYRYWQPGGGHDLNIFSMEKAIEKAEYCHNNPVKRRLVRSPEQYRWSSFRWLVQGGREGEPLHVDDWVEG